MAETLYDFSQPIQSNFSLTPIGGFPAQNPTQTSAPSFGPTVEKSLSTISGLDDLVNQYMLSDLTARNNINQQLGKNLEWQNSWGDPEVSWLPGGKTLSTLGAVGQTLGGIADIYTGFKMLDIADQQLGIAKEQWQETKNEVQRIKNTRQKLNTSYMS